MDNGGESLSLYPPVVQRVTNLLTALGQAYEARIVDKHPNPWGFCRLLRLLSHYKRLVHPDHLAIMCNLKAPDWLLYDSPVEQLVAELKEATEFTIPDYGDPLPSDEKDFFSFAVIMVVRCAVALQKPTKDEIWWELCNIECLYAQAGVNFTLVRAVPAIHKQHSAQSGKKGGQQKNVKYEHLRQWATVQFQLHREKLSEFGGHRSRSWLAHQLAQPFLAKAKELGIKSITPDNAKVRLERLFIKIAKNS